MIIFINSINIIRFTIKPIIFTIRTLTSYNIFFILSTALSIGTGVVSGVVVSNVVFIVFVIFVVVVVVVVTCNGQSKYITNDFWGCSSARVLERSSARALDIDVDIDLDVDAHHGGPFESAFRKSLAY